MGRPAALKPSKLFRQLRTHDELHIDGPAVLIVETVKAKGKDSNVGVTVRKAYDVNVDHKRHKGKGRK